MLKKVLRRMGGMSAPAWYIFRISTQLCLFLLASGVLLTTGSPAQRRLAGALYECSEAVLLIGTLGSAAAEDRLGRR